MVIQCAQLVEDGYSQADMRAAFSSWSSSLAVLRKLMQAKGKLSADSSVWEHCTKELQKAPADRFFQVGLEEMLNGTLMNSLSELDVRPGDPTLQDGSKAYPAIGRFLRYALTAVQLANGVNETLPGFANRERVHTVKVKGSAKVEVRQKVFTWSNRPTRYMLLMAYVTRLFAYNKFIQRLSETETKMTDVVAKAMQELRNGQYDPVILFTLALWDERSIANKDIGSVVTEAVMNKVLVALGKAKAELLIKGKPKGHKDGADAVEPVLTEFLMGKAHFIEGDSADDTVWRALRSFLQRGDGSGGLQLEDVRNVLIAGSPPWGAILSGLRYRSGSAPTATHDVGLNDDEIERYVHVER